MDKDSEKEEERPEKDLKELRAWLEKSFFEKIDRLKEKKGIKNTTELLRVMLTEGLKEVDGDSLNINVKIDLKSIQPFLDQILDAIKKKNG